MFLAIGLKADIDTFVYRQFSKINYNSLLSFSTSSFE